MLQGCTLYSNWWPMLTLFFYVLIPMPYLFFGAAPTDSFYSSGVEVGCALSPACLEHAIIDPELMFSSVSVCICDLVPLCAVGMREPLSVSTKLVMYTIDSMM